MRLWDPHFHVWDVSDRIWSGHDPSELFAPHGDPIYSLADFENDLAIDGFELTGGVCVEAMSVCHVRHEGAEFSSACLAEARWVSNQLSRSPRAYWMVACAPLEQFQRAVQLVAEHPRTPYHEFRELVCRSSEVDRQKLFADRARRIYCRKRE